MKPETLLREAIRWGVTIAARGGNLVITPAEDCPPEFADLLREHKPMMVAFLKARTTNLQPDQVPWVTLRGKFWPESLLRRIIQPASPSRLACALSRIQSVAKLWTSLEVLTPTDSRPLRAKVKTARIYFFDLGTFNEVRALP